MRQRLGRDGGRWRRGRRRGSRRHVGQACSATALVAGALGVCGAVLSACGDGAAGTAGGEWPRLARRQQLSVPAICSDWPIRVSISAQQHPACRKERRPARRASCGPQRPRGHCRRARRRCARHPWASSPYRSSRWNRAGRFPSGHAVRAIARSYPGCLSDRRSCRRCALSVALNSFSRVSSSRVRSSKASRRPARLESTSTSEALRPVPARSGGKPGTALGSAGASAGPAGLAFGLGMADLIEAVGIGHRRRRLWDRISRRLPARPP